MYVYMRKESALCTLGRYEEMKKCEEKVGELLNGHCVTSGGKVFTNYKDTIKEVFEEKFKWVIHDSCTRKRDDCEPVGLDFKENG
jgi:hypothetical protein